MSRSIFVLFAMAILLAVGVAHAQEDYSVLAGEYSGRAKDSGSITKVKTTFMVSEGELTGTYVLAGLYGTIHDCSETEPFVFACLWTD